MKKNGIEVLSSGNLFKWERLDGSGRGGVTGNFTSPPSESDIREGQAFSRSLAPAGAQMHERVIDANPRQVKSVLDQFVFGGNRN